jgi:hypothetical protein
MATPTLSEPGLATDPTQQQLDELEALIERMLELPFAQLESSPGNPSPAEAGLGPLMIEQLGHRPTLSSVTGSFDEGTSAARVPLSTADPTPEERINPQAPITRADTPDDDTGFELSIELDPQAGAEVAGSIPAEDHLPQRADDQDGQDRLQPDVELPATEQTEPRPYFALLPLIWLNTAFDLAAAPFGPMGRWLRGTGGRAFLGWTGIVLLAIAGVLVGMQWVPWKV